MLLKELKRFPVRPVDDTGEYGVDAGKYVGIRFTPDTKATLRQIIDTEGVPNPINPEKLHSTVACSRGNNIPGYEVDGKFEEPEEAEIDCFTIFPSQDGKNCLVAKLSAPTLVDRHNKTMQHGANYDYDEYIPHVTLSYDAGEWDESSLDDLTKKYKGIKLLADEEYEEEIREDFGKSSMD